MVRHICFVLAFGILVSVEGYAQGKGGLPSFEDYKVPVYTGKIRRPKWIRYNKRERWRDDLGKLVPSPEVNFSGKFFVTVHSCGTGCRYYTLTELTTGKDLDVLRGFGSDEEPPTTRDGYEYRENLFFVPNSKLLIVQYGVEKQDRTECRERSFLFENSKLRPITPTIYSCRVFGMSYTTLSE